ncbi:MAG: hypothetical protein O7G85_12880, partial [Planctomycetota bacterium]|nr:hypothetical protein [Planctomycetota bacterium]
RYQQLIKENAPATKAYQRTIDLLEDLDRSLLVDVLIFETSRDLGAPDEDELFIDYGHMTRAGGRLLTRRITDVIQAGSKNQN